jgi:hypothetical protein
MNSYKYKHIHIYKYNGIQIYNEFIQIQTYTYIHYIQHGEVMYTKFHCEHTRW